MADALSRKLMALSIHSSWKMLEDMVDYTPVIKNQQCFLAQLTLRPLLIENLVEAQKQDSKIQELVGKPGFSQGADGEIRFKGRLCVPQNDNLKKELMNEAHKSKFSIHLGSTKMYRDLRRNFWWNGMKKDIAEFVSK